MKATHTPQKKKPATPKFVTKAEISSVLIGLAVVDSKIKTIISVTNYVSRTNHRGRKYCRVSIPPLNIVGYGIAGGGGYCKASAAAAIAIQSAGIQLSEDISGCGMSAVREAMVAIGALRGQENIEIIETC